MLYSNKPSVAVKSMKKNIYKTGVAACQHIFLFQLRSIKVVVGVLCFSFLLYEATGIMPLLTTRTWFIDPERC